MDISLDFKKLTLVSGDKLTISIAHSAMQKMITELVAQGYLTTEELIILAIGQIKLCEQKHLEHVLPENVFNKLTEAFESVKNGGNNE